MTNLNNTVNSVSKSNNPQSTSTHQQVGNTTMKEANNLIISESNVSNQKKDFLIVEKPKEEWPELIPLEDGTQTIEPIDLECFPSWFKDMVKAVANHVEIDPSYVAGVALSTLALVVSRSVKIEDNNGHTETLNLMITSIAESGSGKSEVFKHICRPLYEWARQQNDALKQEIKGKNDRRRFLEKQIKYLEQKLIKLADSDENKEDRSQLLTQLDEAKKQLSIIKIANKITLIVSDVTSEQLGILLNNNHNSLGVMSSDAINLDKSQSRYDKSGEAINIYLKAYSGDSEEIERVGREAIHLSCPRLTILNSAQPIALTKTTNVQLLTSRGLLARFLYIHTKSNIGFRKLENPVIPAKIAEDYGGTMKELLERCSYRESEPVTLKNLHTITLEPDASKALHEFRCEIEKELRPEGSLSHIKEWGAKLPGNTLRIAGVLHVAQNSCQFGPWGGELDAVTMRQAINISRQLITHAHAAFGLFLPQDDELSLAKKVLDAIIKYYDPPKILTINELRKRIRRIAQGAEKFKAILETLEELGHIMLIEQPIHNKSRPSPIIQLRPEYIAPRKSN